VNTTSWQTAALVAAGTALLAEPAPAQQGALIEEIVVTARKQEESLRDVPVSATALTGDELRDAFVVDSVDVVRMIPNAIIAYGGGPDYLNNIIIRGQGGGRSGTSETATGIYRNGVYVAGGTYGGLQLMRLDLFDLERLETFRGPQGAVYGRNAVGGAVNAVTAKPQLDGVSARARIGYEDVERLVSEAVVNVPVVDERLGLRLGGYYTDQADGFYENITTGEQLDEATYWGGRLGLRGVSEDGALDATLWLETMSEEAPSFAAYAFRPDPPFDQDEFDRPFNGPSEVEIEQDSVFLDASWDLGGPTASLAAVWLERDGERIDDLDWFLGIANGSAGLIATQQAEMSRTGVELRLSSAPAGRLRWMVGAEAFEFEEDRTTSNLNFAAASTVTAADETDSWSLFGLLRYDLTAAVEVTGELRYSEDDKANATEQVRLADDVVLRSFAESETFENLQPAATVRWQARDWVNVYGRIATAYRAGGFNDQPPAGVAGGAVFAEEKSISYETGAKMRLLENRLQLDVALYVLETEDIQIVARGPQPPNPVYLQNGGDARNLGLEVDLRSVWAVPATAGSLSAKLGFSVSDGEYTSGEFLALQGGSLVTVDLDGRDLSRLRDFTASVSLDYSQPVAGGLEGFARLLYQIEEGGFEDAANNDPLADFDILDGRIGLRGDGWEASLYGKNLTDELYVVERLTTGQRFVNRPRIWGAELRVEI
jgi:outer membrane receptor protein involved in Fe transport